MSTTMTADKADAFTTADPFDAVTRTSGEAANLRARAALMDAINDRLDDFGWTQAAAATHLGVTQPRVSDLRRDRVSKFSLDALVLIGAKVGVGVVARHC